MYTINQRVRRRYSQSLYWMTIGAHSVVPNTVGSYYVVGHGKSGTNWLCSILSTYYDIPVFEGWTRWLPSTRSQIFHLHRFVVTPMARRRTFYLYRDGRDIVISSYFARLRQPYPVIRRRFEAYIGEPMDEKRLRSQLPEYIDWFFGVDRSSSLRWQQHIDEALSRPYVRISFEDMKRNPHEAVGRAIFEVDGDSVHEKRLAEAIDYNDFSRKKTKSNNSHFLRAGRSGDWRNYFTRDAANRFNHHAGRALVALGYAESLDWSEDCPES